MCPLIPAELAESAVQFVVYFVTIAGIALGVMVGGQA